MLLVRVISAAQNPCGVIHAIHRATEPTDGADGTIRPKAFPVKGFRFIPHPYRLVVLVSFERERHRTFVAGSNEPCNMNRTLILIGSAAALAVMLTSGTDDNNGKAGRTGAPGEQTCVNSCHNSYALNSGTGSIALGSTNMTGWQYVPGQTYHMTVTVSLSTSVLFGFDVECLTSAGANAGTLTVTNSAQTQVKNATVSGNSRRNLVHQQGAGTGAGSKAFAFDWVAPATNIGNVTFYFAGNASNNQNNEAGDRIYTGSQVITPAVATGMEELAWGVDEVVVGPVPFDNSCSVGYTMRSGGDVMVSLLDVNGQVLERLVKTQRAPGRQIEMLTNLDRFAEGTYFILLESEGARTVRKVVRTAN